MAEGGTGLYKYALFAAAILGAIVAVVTDIASDIWLIFAGGMVLLTAALFLMTHGIGPITKIATWVFVLAIFAWLIRFFMGG
jgi:hypothetical protein